MQIKTNIQNLKNYQIYLRVEEAVHEFMKKKGYLEVDLPLLSPALIPESYLDVFETEFIYFNRREKLYLTPSPELFMKRLLALGIKDPYHIGKSFRNREQNSDLHSLEFTMLEFYKIGATYLQLADQILEMMKFINVKCQMANVKLKKNNDMIKNHSIYKGKEISFEKWEKFTVAEAFKKFAGISEEELSDTDLFIKKASQKGYETVGFSYADIFSQIISQEIEPQLGKRGYPTLLYDYPYQMSSLAKLSENGKVAKRVEFYINGIEVGGCCEELNDWKEQKRRFEQEEKERAKHGLIQHRIDKGFIEALQYGLPQCTGAGIGFDRLAMIFCDVDTISDLKLVTIE